MTSYYVCNDDIIYRYRDRYWRESVFRGVELVRKALDESYGADKVSLVSAAFRWLNPLAAIDAKMRHLHPPQVQALSRAH